MSASDDPRLLSPRGMLALLVWAAFWFVTWGALTANGWLGFDKDSFVEGGIQGAVIGLVSLGVERVWTRWRNAPSE